MKISVILGQLYPESFNAAIARIVVQTLLENGHILHFYDSYREKFDPLPQGAEPAGDPAGGAPVVEHQRQIKKAGGTGVHGFRRSPGIPLE